MSYYTIANNTILEIEDSYTFFNWYTNSNIDDILEYLFHLQKRLTELENAQKSGSKTGRMVQEPNQASKKRKRALS